MRSSRGKVCDESASKKKEGFSDLWNQLLELIACIENDIEL
jgi:hypothetical protein